MAGSRGSNDDYAIGVPYPQYVLLPGSSRRARTRRSCAEWTTSNAFALALLLICLITVGYTLLPKEPEVEVERITFGGINLHVDDKTSLIPSVYMDVSMDLRLRITNFNFYGVLYDKLVVEFYYRGDNLGRVESRGGEVPSLSMSMATAKVELLGAPLLNHATEIIADVYSREVPLQTVTEFNGSVEMFIFRPKIKMKVYCDMVVEPIDKEVLSTSCSLIPFSSRSS